MGWISSLFAANPSRAVQSQRPAGSMPLEGDVRASAPHLLLLSKFMHGATAESFAGDFWNLALAEDSQEAIKRFRAGGLIEPASVVQKLGMTLGSKDTKEKARNLGLKVSGTKAQVLERITKELPETAALMVKDVQAWSCTESGRALAVAYMDEIALARTQAQAESMRLLRAGDFNAAAALVKAFEFRQVFSRGLNVNWPNRDVGEWSAELTLVAEARPALLKGLSEDDMFELGTAAAMGSLWGENRYEKWLPDDVCERVNQRSPLGVDTGARMMEFAGRNQRDLARFKAMRIEYVTVLAAGEMSCETCRTLSGKRFKLATAPTLPHKDCTHPMGCRCLLQPDIL